MKTKNLTYSELDLVFVGMGAANSLLFFELKRKGLLTDKKIAIIEPNSKTENDRTFCFWALESEITKYHLDDLISKSWRNASAGERVTEAIDPYKYFHISGIDLYNYARKDIVNFDVTYIRELATDELLAEFHEATIFDSRPPKFNDCKKDESHLIQSFLGWNITTTADVFDPDTFVMMDFSIEQGNSTLFLYILPFDQRNALVEVTSFHSESINIPLAEEILKKEIHERFGEFQIISTEQGKIPMSTAQISHTEISQNHILTGARAGNIKPSTGYSFLKSCNHAVEISNSLQHKTSIKIINPPVRFKFYDRLLLKILEKNPTFGKTIFESLFRKNPLSRVIEFLREESSGMKELRILGSLPILPFVKAAILDTFYRLPILKLLPLFLAMAFLILDALNLVFISNGLLLLGLILVGIPHGAIDHLLESKQLEAKIKPTFILNYLFKMALMGLVWFVNAYLGLLLFILYSAWHFGEAEFKNLSVSSFLWGLSLLGCILFAHPQELTEILKEMSVNIDFINFQWALIFSGGVFLTTQFSRGIHRICEVLWLPLSLFLPLLSAFGLFFIFNHSVNSSADIIRNYKEPISRLWLKAMPFSLGAFLFLGGFYYFDIWKTDGMTGVFFIFLSCISFPHVFAMHGFYHNFKGTSINKISA